MSQVRTDLAQLDALASELRRQGGAAGSLRSAVTGRLDGTDWTGLSAQSFRDRWAQDYEPMLRRLEQDLGQLGAYVAQKREEFDQAGNR